MERKLTAILSADVQGYSRLMGEDEEATLRALTAYRGVTDSLILQHRGRVVGSAGDSVLAEFASAVDAAQCAVEIQKALKAKNAAIPPERKMEFRIGINVGDVVVEGDQIYGDGVNVAARLQGLADAGGVFISGTVYDQIENKLALSYEYLGEQTVKNIAKPVRAYRVLMEPVAASPPVGAATQGRPEGPGYRRRAAMVGAALLLMGAGVVAIRNLSSSPTPGQPHGVAPTTPQPTALPEQPPALPLPNKPSIAVLPFVNISEDPKQDYFSDGITEELITGLSRLSGLFVIARTSVFTYKGRAVKVEEVSKELGVQYVLEGSVRKADSQLRITAQLVDATTGYHLWTERYDRPLKDIFALQDEVTQKIVFALRVKLTQEEQERFRRAPTDNLDAYDYLLRGWEYFNRSTKEANAQARQMFERAVELDPRYAAAYAFLGLTHLRDWSSQWSSDPQSLEQAFALAQRAVALDDSLPLAHLILGDVYLWKKQYAQALTEGFRARALDPNNPDIAVGLAEILDLTGTSSEALGLVERAMRLNPRYPDWYLLVLGRAYDWLAQREQKIAVYKRILARNPDSLPAHLNLAGIYSELGREAEARAEVKEVLRISPNFSLKDMKQREPIMDPEMYEDVFDLLGKAGLQ